MTTLPHTPATSGAAHQRLGGAPATAMQRTEHKRSLTRRLLAGEGAVELAAYRSGDTLSSAVHGVCRLGHLVVADIPNLFHSLGSFHTVEDIEVRVDISKDSADHALALRLASVHLLGTLRWCRDTDEVEALGLQGRVADLVHDLGPRVRVGVVRTERVLLHDSCGVAAHGAEVVTEAATAIPLTESLRDAVLATPREVLAEVADAVLDGGLPGWAESLDLPGAMDPTVGPAHAVDVDPCCVSLFRFIGDRGWIVQVPLTRLAAAQVPGSDGVSAWRGVLDSLPTRRFTV